MDGAVSLLRSAVIACAEPLTKPQQRQEAYQVCEEFKSTCAENIQVILILISPEESHNVRHYALSMIEHIIKYQWNNLAVLDKQQLKNVCMDIIHKISRDEPIYIGDSIAKCVVEIVKREWPQNWPSFIDEMGQLGTTPDYRKTDIVMRVLLRLAEDVVILNTIEHAQRRKDIQAALTESLKTVLPFLVKSLQELILKRKNTEDHTQRDILHRLIVTTLDTMMGYVGWCDASLISADDNLLMQILLGNLTDTCIQMSCVECLLVITYRHGNPESLTPVLTLYYQQALDTITQVTQVTMQSASSNINQYVFLKRLCQLIISMGEQLVNLMTKDPATYNLPETFPQYFKLLLTLTSHSSLFIASSCTEFLVILVRAIKKNPFLHDEMMELCNILYTKIHKIGSPSDPTNPECLDYDDETDWLNGFYKMKTNIVDVIYVLKTLKHQELLIMCLKHIADMHTTAQQLYSGPIQSPCDLKSEFFIRLDAINNFVHACLKNSPPIADLTAIQIFQSLLNTTVQEPQVLGLILSCISALFPVLPHVEKSVLEHLLKKIFDLVNFRIEASSNLPDKFRIDLARHSSAVFIKLATLYPQLLTSYFTDLHSYIEGCRQTVTRGTCRSLQEGLVLVSNEMRSFGRQVEYIRIVLIESLEKWSNPQLQAAFESPEKFAGYIGLRCEPDTQPVYNERRYQIQELLRDFLMVLRRVTTPTTIETSEGFLDQNGVIRSPSVEVMFPVINSLLQCLNATLGLYNPELVSTYHVGYCGNKVLDLPEAERKLLQGLSLQGEDFEKRQIFRTDMIAVQKHILDTIDSMEQVLVFISRNSPVQFYSYNNIAQIISYIITSHVNQVNWFVFRSLIKCIVKPLCCNPKVTKSDPSSNLTSLKDQFVLAMIKDVLPCVVNRLDNKWQQVKQQLAQNTRGLSAGAVFESDEDKTDNEIVEHELLRLSTRELLEMSTTLFTLVTLNSTKKKGTAAAAPVTDIDMSDNAEMNGRQPTAASGAAEIKLTPLAYNLPLEELNGMLSFFTSACCWLDTLSAFKAVDLLYPITKLAFERQVITCDMSQQVLHSLLMCLHIHGQHDNMTPKLLTTLVLVYSLLRPRYEGITQVMLQIPGVTPQNLKKYEVDVGIKLSGDVGTGPQIALKKKKIKMNALVKTIIGTNINEQFRERVVIRDLPPLVKQKTKLSDVISATADSDTVGLCQLFTPS